MAVQITVILDGNAGAMTRVITAIKRLGLTFSGHRIESLGDARSRLTVNADGNAAAQELREKLAAIKGVAGVIRVSSDDGVDTARHGGTSVRRRSFPV